MDWREQQISGERKSGQRCARLVGCLAKKRRLEQKGWKKKQEQQSCIHFLNGAWASDPGQSRWGFRASKKQCWQTKSLPRHFGRTSAVAVNLFVVPIGGRGLLWSSGWMQTDDFNYALIKWESLRRNCVCPFPPYPSILNQQLSGSLWIKHIAIYQKQHTDSLQVSPVGNRPTPHRFHTHKPLKKRIKYRGYYG